MLFIFSTPEIIRHLWQLKTAVFLHWCLICVVPFLSINPEALFQSEASLSQAMVVLYQTRLLFRQDSYSYPQTSNLAVKFFWGASTSLILLSTNYLKSCVNSIGLFFTDTCQSIGPRQSDTSLIFQSETGLYLGRAPYAAPYGAPSKVDFRVTCKYQDRFIPFLYPF